MVVCVCSWCVVPGVLQEFAKQRKTAKDMFDQMTADARHRLKERNAEIEVLKGNLGAKLHDLEKCQADMKETKGASAVGGCASTSALTGGRCEQLRSPRRNTRFV